MMSIQISFFKLKLFIYFYIIRIISNLFLILYRWSHRSMSHQNNLLMRNLIGHRSSRTSEWICRYLSTLKTIKRTDGIIWLLINFFLFRLLLLIQINDMF